MPVLLPIHIVAGGLGIIAGAMALSAAKGGGLHRSAGRLFVSAMVAMSASASIMAAAKGETPNFVGGLMTAYLVITAWRTVQPARNGSRIVDMLLMIGAAVLSTTDIVLGFAVATAPQVKGAVPAPAYFIFGGIGLLAAAGDLRMIRAPALTGAPRLKRHLWRMCWALFMATASFFSIRARVARVLPYPFTTPPMRALPVILVLGAMVYWLWRLRRTRLPRATTAIDRAIAAAHA